MPSSSAQGVTALGLPPLTVGDLVMTPEEMRVRYQGAECHLTPAQFLVLHALASRPNIIKSWDDVLDIALVEDGGPEVARHIIKRIRKALNVPGRTFHRVNKKAAGRLSDGPIMTQYGTGWKWVDGQPGSTPLDLSIN